MAQRTWSVLAAAVIVLAGCATGFAVLTDHNSLKTSADRTEHQPRVDLEPAQGGGRIGVVEPLPEGVKRTIEKLRTRGADASH